MERKKIIVGIIGLVGLMVFVSAASSIYRTACLNDIGNIDCPYRDQVILLTDIIPLLTGLGIMAGVGTFYYMSGKVVQKDVLLKKNTETILRFLSREERLVVNKLVEGKGRALQSEITRIPELGKVKSHRIIGRLIERGVLEKEDFGKTNMVRLSKDVMEGLGL